jgi:hypothetical protein
MVGQQSGERELFSYAINLDERVRSDHPLRRIAGRTVLWEQGQRLSGSHAPA